MRKPMIRGQMGGQKADAANQTKPQSAQSPQQQQQQQHLAVANKWVYSIKTIVFLNLQLPFYLKKSRWIKWCAAQSTWINPFTAAYFALRCVLEGGGGKNDEKLLCVICVWPLK